MSRAYLDFLASKAISDPCTGMADIPDLPDSLFPHQRDIVAWALRRGRAALFAGTGLGKSLMELAWAQAVSRHTGKPVLHLAPLAVSAQIVREAQKFGIPAHMGDGEGICVTNYQKLDHFDLSRFGAIILDESSILKSTDGHYRNRLIAASQSIPFRLAATATPAPNDFMELGNHAEFLGIMSYTDMLATFFVHDGGSTQNWRLKGHAENEFWRWMASWAVMLRKPSDLGYSNAGYDLPPLHYHQHIVGVEYAPSIETGMLFPMQAATLQERIAARRDTVEERVKMAAQIVIGSFGDKLAEWHGNQNTQSAAESAESQTPNIGQSETSNPLATSGGERNTCENIGQTTSISGRERQSSGTKSTPAGASDMQPMPNIGSAQKPLQDSGRQKNGASSCSEQNTISHPLNMMNCSESRMEFAPSATEGTGESDSTSTIATIKATSEGFSARHATQVSGTSRTTQTASQGLSNISEKLEPWVVWCHLNSEQDALKKAFGPLAISIHGQQSEDEKEQLHQDWLNGKAPILICKPKMFGYGLNWQHCRNTVFVGLNDSFEQFYQAIRRFWRFGQSKPVNCHIIAAETEGATVANIRRKEMDADRMAAAMVMHMADLSSRAIKGSVRETPNYDPRMPVILPSFLECAA